MIAIIQRVSQAKVEIKNQTVASIKKGLLILIGIKKGDLEYQADKLVDKILKLRIFSDETGKMNKSVLDIGGEILVVSQFTLLGDTKKGNRPSFIKAEEPKRAEKLFNYIFESFKKKIPTQKGVFGANMQVHLINDGPVTLILEA